MNWVWENRTWLFSGAGITVLACIVWLVRRFLIAQPKATLDKHGVIASVHASASPNSPVAVGANISQTIIVSGHNEAASKSTVAYLHEPSPINIIDAIQEARPFDKDRIVENYIGLAVRWSITLESVEKSWTDKPGFWHVSGRSGKNGQISLVIFEVDESKYPRLKILPAKHELEVEGIISKITLGGHSIVLTEARLFFPESH
jgi:hypothetical protein